MIFLSQADMPRYGQRLLMLALLCAFGSQAHAEDTAGRLSFIEENDKFASHDDRHYTQGAALSYLSAPVEADSDIDQLYNWLGDSLPIYQNNNNSRRFDLVAGQSIFTPTNTQRPNPSPRDRPYAAWLYAGGGLLQESRHDGYDMLENTELLVGTVGPAALGGVTQNDFHQFIGVSPAQGWHEQLKDEPGLIATYERKWRFQQPLPAGLAVDAIPELGGSAGNILTYAEAGGMVRFGHNLAADYGPDRIRPSLSGTNWFNPARLDGDLGWYLFMGLQGRAVARNIFLDGNTFAPSAGVEHKPLVADFTGGASLLWSSSLRLDFTATQRTKEFDTQRGHPDRFGGVNLAFSF